MPPLPPGPSTPPAPVDDTAAPFSAAARPDLTDGRSIGVLLSHGFTGSPFSMRPWAEHLAEQGYAVEVPRLPGHGTRWQEMNRTRWEDWYGEVRRTFDRLRTSCDAVVVGGLSMGGALVLQLAAERPEQVSGVVLVNPAVNLERRVLATLPVLKWVVPSLPGITDDIKRPGTTEHGYDRTPLKALHSQVQGWAHVRAQLHRVTAPVLLLRSVEDHVLDSSSAEVILREVSCQDLSEVMLPNCYHVATLDHDADVILEESAAFVRRVTS
jgi:carboxylesterase